jgi:hypothetical protein
LRPAGKAAKQYCQGQPKRLSEHKNQASHRNSFLIGNAPTGNAFEWPSDPRLGLFAQVRLREKHKEDSADPFASRKSQIPGVLPAFGHSNPRTSAGSSCFLVVREWHPACGKYY